MTRKEQLLADTFGDGEEFALVAAALARRRRAVRRAAFVGGVAAAVIAVVFVTYRPVRPLASVQIATKPAIEIMSDADLLAQLKNQPVLILKDKSGITGVVFLDDKTANRL